MYPPVASNPTRVRSVQAMVDFGQAERPPDFVRGAFTVIRNKKYPALFDTV